MDGCLVKMDVLLRSADAVPVDDWSYMEYTFNPAAYKQTINILLVTRLNKTQMKIALC